jgi:hypothetical protein
MLFHSDRLPVSPTPIFDAAFFAQGVQTDVIVRDADGKPIENADGSFLTVKGEMRDLLVPMSGDRAAELARAATNQRRFVEQANDWVGALSSAAQEIERIRPTGVDKNKTPKTNVQGFSFADNGGAVTISAQTANTLWAARDANGARLLTKFFGFSNAELGAFIQANLGNPTEVASGFAGFPGFTTGVVISKMQDDHAFATFENGFESTVDRATQQAQLEQTSFQGLVSRQNNAIETMADLQQKFTATIDKLVGNLRLAR